MDDRAENPLPVASTLRATFIGALAILLWSLLALLTVATGVVPPFELAALSFAVGGLLGAATWLFRSGAARAIRQPPEVWLLGVGGLFGYHALYFMALRLAPPAEAGLVCYLWPLLIVLLSAPLLKEPLRIHHVAGAMLGLGGATLLFLARGIAFSVDFLPGYCVAFVAAFVWAIYSVLSRRFARVPTDAVVGFCLVTSILAALCHIFLEDFVWPSPPQWIAVMGLGLGPVGAAFYAWDFGMKHGDVRVLGAASYAAPVLSTALLVAAGYARPSPVLALAALLIGGGGLLAAKTLMARRDADLGAQSTR